MMQAKRSPEMEQGKYHYLQAISYSVRNIMVGLAHKDLLEDLPSLAFVPITRL